MSPRCWYVVPINRAGDTAESECGLGLMLRNLHMPLRRDWLLMPEALLQLLIMWPLELYEAVAILPVSFLRRHVPVLGGALVVLMTLHGILLRLFLELLRAIVARVTYSRDPVLTFDRFWRAMQDHYAFLEPRRVDWQLVRQLFGDTIQTATSDDDLWIALRESISLCDDASIVVSRVAGATAGAIGPRTMTVRGRKLPTVAAQNYKRLSLAAIEREHLTQGGRKIANNRFVCGILNAETSPGWRIGYVCLTAMQGFVEFPLPRVETLMPSWSRGAKTVETGAEKMLLEENGKPRRSRTYSSISVPEIYDLESMRWSLEAILLGLGDVDGLILDLRFNQGGGSHVAALTVASFFASEKKAALAFSTDEKLPGAIPRFSKKKNYYIPYTSRCTRFRGPLAVLQSQYTRGTAELLCLSLMKRPLTSRIGGTTAGCLSATRQLRLPNYWTVDIPHQRIFSADNEIYEGVGIPPTEIVPGMEPSSSNESFSMKDRTLVAASSAAFDPCIRKAIDHIMDIETTRNK